MPNLNPYGVVICGQVLTGRLEVLEGFLKKRFENLFVIGASSIFAKYNAARCVVYKNGNKISENKLFNLTIKRSRKFKGLFFILAYSVYFISIFFCILRFRLIKKDLIFMGIGCFPALAGIAFKKIKLVKKVIYYSIDYFSADKAFVFLDKFCAKESDVVWLISPKILEAREKFVQLDSSKYRHIPVPLCFDESLLKHKAADMVERWSIVFVGTSGYFHGLHLLIEAMPKLIAVFPELQVKIIGPGPWDDIKNKVNELGLGKHFIFTGFIKEEDELFEAISKNALGLALYVPAQDNPTLYADPGKPKAYAFCAVPIVISQVPGVAKEIEMRKAGIAIDFNAYSLTEAIKEILSDDTKWMDFRKNAFSFAKDYTSKNILTPAIEESLILLNV